MTEPRSRAAGEQDVVHVVDLGAGIAASAVAHVVVDRRGIIRGGNAAFLSLIERAQFPLHRPFIGVLPVSHAELFWRVLHVVCSSRSEGTFDCEVSLPTGTHCHLRIVASPIANGAENAALFALVDVTDLARAEADARRQHEEELTLRTRLEVLASAQLQIGEAAVRAGGMNELLAVIADAARDVAEADFAAVSATFDGAPPLVVARGQGDEREARFGHGPPTAEVLDGLAREAPDSFLAVPIELHGASLGTLYVGFSRITGRFEDDDVRLVGMLARRAAFAIEKMRAVEREVQRRAWLQAVMDKIPEPLLVAQPNGAVLANEMARALTTTGPGEEPRFDLRDSDGRALADDEMPIERAAHGESVVAAELVLHANGHEIPVLVNATPVVAQGRRLGAVCVWRDVTTLRALEKLREEWAAIVAHGLRQPLTVIKMSDELIAKSIAKSTKDDDPAMRAVERIRVSVRRMWAMIEELIDTSLIESHRLHVKKEPVCVAACVREVIEQFRPQLEGRAVELRAPDDSDTIIAADAARLEQVLSNLLSNACKYGARDRPVTVHIERVDHSLKIVVENEGVTLAEQELAHMFTRFFRTEAAAQSKVRGLGLGLHIVRGLVRAHGGEVHAHSKDGRVSFEITLPTT